MAVSDGNAAPLAHNVVDARGRHIQGLGECVGTHAQRNQKIFPENFAGMNRAHAILEHVVPLSSIVHCHQW
jgi:hypothetical protein